MMLSYGMVWYDMVCMVWCGMNDVVCNGTVWYGLV